MLGTPERHRQVVGEGWTTEHDDAHGEGEMLRAAVLYIWHGTDRAPTSGRAAFGEQGVPMGWPWAAKWWKPRDRRNNLIRAGALCLAERDRLIRAGRATGPADHKLGVAIRELVKIASPLQRQAEPW